MENLFEMGREGREGRGEVEDGDACEPSAICTYLCLHVSLEMNIEGASAARYAQIRAAEDVISLASIVSQPKYNYEWLFLRAARAFGPVLS